MGFKTELHIHTSEASKCSRISAEELIEVYIEKGYTTVVITDHYNDFNFKRIGDITWQEKNDIFISAYNAAKKAANGRINVILGMEYRNNNSNNDYLVFGVTEDFIRKNNVDDEHNTLSMNLKEFTDLAHANNMLIFQAHPFRDGMKIINPSYLDGIEVLNANVGHDSRNDVAKLWAEKYKLLECAGSDCHDLSSAAAAAIVTDFPITNNEELIEALKKYPIIKNMSEE